MRSLVWFAALVATFGAARAEDVRGVPAVGSKLTYRFVSTTTTPRVKVSAGEVYTYIVTASDAASAKGSSSRSP